MKIKAVPLPIDKQKNKSSLYLSPTQKSFTQKLNLSAASFPI